MQRNNCNASFSVREWPLIKLRNHPIETGEYLVASDAVVRTCDTVTKWIEIGCPVGVIHGRPRLGKTRAIQYIINEFAGNGSAWPVSMIICKKYQTPSEASFYEDMLSDIGHGIIGGHVKNKHNRLCRLLLEKSELSGTNHFVFSWIQNRSPGGIVFGRPRIGKTWAIAYLLNELSTGENSMPVFSIQCRRYKVASASSFFEDLLRGVGHDVIYGNKVSLKRDRLNNYLIEKGQLSNTNRIILILDDAQRLHSSHYDWLMDVYNELNYNGIF